MPRSVSDLFYFFRCVHLHVCFLIFFVAEKLSYRYVISFDSMKLRQTNVCLWKSTRTVFAFEIPLLLKRCKSNRVEIAGLKGLDYIFLMSNKSDNNCIIFAQFYWGINSQIFATTSRNHAIATLQFALRYLVSTKCEKCSGFNRTVRQTCITSKQFLWSDVLG